MASQHGIVGDDNFGTDLPQTTVNEDVLEPSVQRAADFARSGEYKRLKEAMESRIEYWQAYTPGADNPVMYRDLNNDERGWRSLVADVLISEFRSIFAAYEQAIEETQAKPKKP